MAVQAGTRSADRGVPSFRPSTPCSHLWHPFSQVCGRHLTWALCFARCSSSLNPGASRSPSPLSVHSPLRGVSMWTFRESQDGEEELGKGSGFVVFYLSLRVSLGPGLGPVCFDCADLSRNSHLPRTWSVAEVLIIFFCLPLNSCLGEPGRS